VRRCIESVLTHTSMARAEVLLIDDASTDPGTRSLLARYGKLPHVTLLRNEQNLGFTRTVNRGIQHVKGRDIVLLNSDTVVGPRWLEALAAVAYGAQDVATATALSDNAGAFSTPRSGANDTNSLLPVYDAARLSGRLAPTQAHFVPTGNGFCMYMRRDAIDATGLLDEINFPRGYGEENDWCMRAGELGWRHAIALHAYAHHVNAVSFGAEAKQKLRDDARQVLDRLHPDYSVQIKRAFGPGTPLTSQREAMEDALDKVRKNHGAPVRPRVMFVVSTRNGGTPLTNEDLMRGISHLYEPLLLVSDTRELQLIDYSEQRPIELARHSLSEQITFIPHDSAEYDAVVARWLMQFGVELVHVRHIAWHSLGLVQVAKRLEIPVVFSFHDFYTMCPSVNLTNGKDPWCESGVVSPHVYSPLWVRRDPRSVEAVEATDPNAVLALWKRRMNAMLSGCDAFVTTSAGVKEILSKNLPILAERSQDFHVIPHGRDFDHFLAPARAPRRREPLRALVAGNITESKGLDTLLEMLRLDEDEHIELHVIGTGRESLIKHPRVRNHGAYARKDFDKLVAKIKPHVGLVLSIWPETFCHTLTECWAAGVPVVGSNLGAVGERIRESGIGWAVDPHDAAGILALLQRIRKGDEDWSEQVQALGHWRQTAGEFDVAKMAERYLDVYAEVTQRYRRLLPSGGRRELGLRRRVALVVRGHFPQSLPTSHVRIATQVAQSSGDSFDYDWIDAAELIRVGVRSYDGVIVCRNAGPPRVLAELARRCRSEAVRLVFDLDDDLLNVPSDKDPGGVYPLFAPALRELLAVAWLTLVSTPRLATLYSSRTREIKLVPNRLDPRLWFEPLSEEEVPLPAELEGDTSVRLLYMGSPTHDEDLGLILPAFERLRAEHAVTLCVIGVTNRETPPGVIAIAPPSSRYDKFIPWFRAIARHFDVAVAPLVDSPFNRAKSALKFMEYAAVHLPVVASRVESYADVIRDGVDGLLAENDVDAWFEELSALVTDANLRKALAEAAYRRAEQEFICRSCAFDQLPWEREPEADQEHTRPSEPPRAATKGARELELEV
jgi:glycosyltransferase involved in cell wall biosynthesis